MYFSFEEWVFSFFLPFPLLSGFIVDAEGIQERRLFWGFEMWHVYSAETWLESLNVQYICYECIQLTLGSWRCGGASESTFHDVKECRCCTERGFWAASSWQNLLEGESRRRSCSGLFRAIPRAATVRLLAPRQQHQSVPSEWGWPGDSVTQSLSRAPRPTARVVKSQLSAFEEGNSRTCLDLIILTESVC